MIVATACNIKVEENPNNFIVATYNEKDIPTFCWTNKADTWNPAIVSSGKVFFTDLNDVRHTVFGNVKVIEYTANYSVMAAATIGIDYTKCNNGKYVAE